MKLLFPSFDIQPPSYLSNDELGDALIEARTAVNYNPVGHPGE